MQCGARAALWVLPARGAVGLCGSLQRGRVRARGSTCAATVLVSPRGVESCRVRCAVPCVRRLGDRHVSVDFAEPTQKEVAAAATRTVWVGSLPEGTTEDVLREAFERFGEVREGCGREGGGTKIGHERWWSQVECERCGCLGDGGEQVGCSALVVV